MATLNKAIQEVLDNTSDVLYREEIYINGKHEYDYHKLEATSETTVHTLYFSDDFEWADHIRKTVAMQLVDTGNGIELIGINSKKEINYLEAEQLHILLRLSCSHGVYQITPPAVKKDF
jgi:hypothetical protein